MVRRLVVASALLASTAVGCTLLTGLDGLREGGAPALDAASDVPNWDKDAEAGATDARIDAPVDAGPCDLGKPFQTPVAVSGLAKDSRNEELARFSPDLLSAWILVRTPDINGVVPAIEKVTRPSLADPFGAGVDSTISPNVLGTTGTSGDFGISADALRLVYGDAAGKLVDCTRSSTSASFACAPIGDGATPFLSPSGARIYGVASGASGLLAPSTLDWVKPAWTAPTKIAELDLYGAPTAFVHPVLTSDEKTIVYEAAGELWLAHRNGSVFGPPEKLLGLGAAKSETHPTWLSDDGCTLALASNRIASMDIFLAKRPK